MHAGHIFRWCMGVVASARRLTSCSASRSHWLCSNMSRLRNSKMAYVVVTFTTAVLSWLPTCHLPKSSSIRRPARSTLIERERRLGPPTARLYNVVFSCRRPGIIHLDPKPCSPVMLRASTRAAECLDTYLTCISYMLTCILHAGLSGRVVSASDCGVRGPRFESRR